MKDKYTILARDFQVSVFPTYMIASVWNKEFQNLLNLTVRFAIANRKKVQEYIIPQDDWDRLQNAVFEKVKRDKKFIKEIAQKAMQAVDRLNDFTEKEIVGQDLSKLSSVELAKLYEKFYKLDLSCYAYGNIIFIMEFGQHGLFSGQLKTILETESEDRRQELFALLSSPVENHHFQKQSLDILKISAEIEKDEKLKDFFLSHSSPEEIEDFIKLKYPDVYQEFVRQKDEYHWLYYSWEGPEMKVTDFILFSRDILKRGRVMEEYENRLNALAELNKKQKAVMDELNFNEENRWVVEIAQFATWFQPYRKARQFKSGWQMEKYFREVGKRLFITLEQARYLTHWEVSQALKDGKVDVEMINKRRNFFVFLYSNGQPICLTGKEAQSFYDNNVAHEILEKKDELKGTPACPGCIKGKARIVNSLEQSQNFVAGEILVSYSTNPTLLPVMRSASAIITEEGGLTCHAAIVSRELNKPCVVGIKGLMSSLTDGDEVEVDAVEGIIKKL